MLNYGFLYRYSLAKLEDYTKLKLMLLIKVKNIVEHINLKHIIVLILFSIAIKFAYLLFSIALNQNQATTTYNKYINI